MIKDLSNELTVFVISCGDNPNFPNCLEALKKQTCKFKLEIIKDFSPMSLAFQEMINRCTTPYYVEIDEDMIIDSNGIETMYNSIKNTGDSIAMTVHKLLDIHLNFEIYGVKIYKYSIFRKYPYNLHHPSCEMEQLEKLKKDGYTYKTIQKAIGKHSPLWTNELIFERYYNLMEKFKLYHYNWLEELPRKLFLMYRKSSTEQNFYAIMGAFSSIFSDTIMEEEKDIRKKRENYYKIKSFLEPPVMATIYLTYNCNFKCEWCLRQYRKLEKAPDMSLEVLNKFIQKFPSIRGYCICGFGETLLSPNLFPILQRLKQTGKIIGLITNGTLLKEKISTLRQSIYSPNYISISLNAHNKETHQKITKTDTWNSILEGIKLATNSQIPIYLTYVTTTENSQYVPDFLRLANSLKIKTVYLHNVLPHFDEKKNTNFWDLVLTKKHSYLIEEWKKLPEAKIVQKFPVLIEKDNCPTLCQFPYKSLAVDGNGNISICNSVLSCSSKMGNIYNDSVWCSEGCMDFRHNFLNENFDFCKKCFRNWERL